MKCNINQFRTAKILHITFSDCEYLCVFIHYLVIKDRPIDLYVSASVGDSGSLIILRRRRRLNRTVSESGFSR